MPSAATGKAERAAALGQLALGLTDHSVMNGAGDLYKACNKLAENDAGFANLIKLTSAGFLEGGAIRPKSYN
jgi:DNA polymerase III subunit alpha